MNIWIRNKKCVLIHCTVYTFSNLGFCWISQLTRETITADKDETECLLFHMRNTGSAALIHVWTFVWLSSWSPCIAKSGHNLQSLLKLFFFSASITVVNLSMTDFSFKLPWFLFKITGVQKFQICLYFSHHSTQVVSRMSRKKLICSHKS